MTIQNPYLVVVDETCNVEESEQPFGKRWGQHLIELSPEHLDALHAGKLLALDVQEEYVVFVGLKREG
ncbi:MAG: hypothetical protein Q8M20_03680 [Rhodocyclaceae bacterium]|nr:hypothetical protein [Rhodocyclaceae bacterium]MDZ4213480.1 hypothetical protein [Rhodocyclaceae bacterium]